MDASLPTDEVLVAQTLRGDDRAFAELAGRHHRKIAGMALRFGKNSHEIDDLLQDIFLQAWRKLSQFRGDVPFEHWLARLATRHCYDLLRRRQRNREDTVEDWERMQHLAPQTESDAGAAKELLDLAILKLSPEERMVIVLMELEEKTLQEVSTLTGWSQSNVKVRAFRARQKLKSILEKIS